MVWLPQKGRSGHALVSRGGTGVCIVKPERWQATQEASSSSVSVPFSGLEVWQVQPELGRADRSQPTAFVTW